AEDGIRDLTVTGVQTCALPILIAIFGSKNKEYGAMKLALYSFFGGIFIFIGILVAYVTAGSLDLNQLAQFQFPPQLQWWAFPVRSEERRVGKECRSEWSRE